jgi:hypothetical protein
MVRTWFEADDGTMRPGKGVNLPIRHGAEIAAAISQAVEIADGEGLL